MSFKLTQIEKIGWKKTSSYHKEMKKQRNRKIRRVKKTEVPNTKKRDGWEY